MKNKQTETKFKSTPGVAHLLTWIVCLGTLILVCASASAQNLFVANGGAQDSTIEGYAADTNGKALKNAEVRIQQEKAKTSPVMVVKTDGKGHFVAANLPAGTYTVSVLLGGTVKWSAANVKTAKGQVVHLNLSQHPAVVVAAANSQPKKRARWVPEQTGSHMGGHWEDEPVRGGPGADDVDTMSTHQLSQIQNAPQSGPSTGERSGVSSRNGLP